MSKNIKLLKFYLEHRGYMLTDGSLHYFVFCVELDVMGSVLISLDVVLSGKGRL